MDGNPVFLQPYVDRMRELFPTRRSDTDIGGVHVHDYTPVEGASERNRSRVLMELHAGAFHEGWPSAAELPSVPIADLARMRVIAVNYGKAAVTTHARLVKLGVEADLHVWEGLFHVFFVNPDIPGSRDAYAVKIRFFDKHLGT